MTRTARATRAPDIGNDARDSRNFVVTQRGGDKEPRVNTIAVEGSTVSTKKEK